MLRKCSQSNVDVVPLHPNCVEWDIMGYNGSCHVAATKLEEQKKNIITRNYTIRFPFIRTKGTQPGRAALAQTFGNLV